jgi:hypothetical protein
MFGYGSVWLVGGGFMFGGCLGPGQPSSAASLCQF